MNTNKLRLVLGNKNYSSWSLRAWLALKLAGIEFEEIPITLFKGNWRSKLAKFTNSARVPVLLVGDQVIWDSMAIIEYVAERCVGSIAWPQEEPLRSWARSISYEMHSGFLAVRSELPMNVRSENRHHFASVSDECRAQVRRIEQIWCECSRNHGPWLFGALSPADILYAPVALRFATYTVPLEPRAQAFVDRVLALPEIRIWSAEAAAEDEKITFVDECLPASETPLLPG